jgi:hypothetical protein
MNPEELEDDLRPEYDFDISKAVRGKYYRQYIESTNVVVLDPNSPPPFRTRKPLIRH